MAKPIVLGRNGNDSEFNFTRLDRAKLYGKRQRQALDRNEKRCEKAELSRDGALLLRSGMAAQAYFNEKHEWVPNSQLVGMDSDGNVVDKCSSTLGVSQELDGPIEARELLDFETRSVYVLDPINLDPELNSELESGSFFRFRFNYRADFRFETAYLTRNDQGTFALIGSPSLSGWCALEQVVQEHFDDPEEADDELDFEMF